MAVALPVLLAVMLGDAVTVALGVGCPLAVVVKLGVPVEDTDTDAA